jgi:hypothetical protein
MPLRDERATDEHEQDPDALCTRAAVSWDRAFRGYDLSQAQKSALVQDGLAAVERALTLVPDHPQALTYKVLLLRLQAAVEPDPTARAALDAEAHALHEKALEEQRLAHVRALTRHV